MTPETGPESNLVEPTGSLSPSRAGDFKACPLLYRFRTLDRLPEMPSADAVRGTLVHKVLEDLFDLPAADRTPARAVAMVEDAWLALLEVEPGVADLFPDEAQTGLGPRLQWFDSCRRVLARYFELEDPQRLEPAERELYVEAVVQHGAGRQLALRGIIDRVDVAADGSVRVVDYKSGRSPAVGFEGRALFQLKFYGLVLWRTRGVVPRLLQLIYLGDGDIVRYQPDEADLLAVERQLKAIWDAVEFATRTGDWQPSPGPVCRWCSFQELCPAFGGTPPPLPVQEAASSADDASGLIGSPS